MRTFAELQTARPLQHFLVSDPGTLYFDPQAQGVNRILVRRFDDATGAATSSATYADIVQAVADWVDDEPDVARWVRVERPREVGADFIVRAYPVYLTGTDAYDFSSEAPVPPPELDAMRRAVREALARPRDAPPTRGAIVARVVERSLLEPTGRTYFNEADDLFVVVEPKITAVEVREWAKSS